LVDGLFIQEQFIQDPWRGSANQTIRFLSNRYSWKDHPKSIHNQLEFFINSNKNIFIAGIPPEPNFLSKFETALKKQGVY